jgi:hypothetical protein
MLVCNVSLRPLGRTIAADLAEAVTAADATATGNVIFATLIDDPASVRDTVDGYLGDIMLEAASASDSFDVGLAYAGAVDEATTSADTLDGAVSVTVFNNWNLSDKSSNISVSGLTVTNTTTSAGGIRGTGSKTTGKIYWETTWVGTPSAARFTCGIGTSASALISLDSTGATVRTDDGFIRVNGAIQASIGAFASGDIAGIAFDLGVSRIWFRRNGGNWNNSGTADPATNVGGYDISAMFPASAAYPSVHISVSTAIAATANFGATTFAFAAPSGFTGWTVP